MYLLLKMLVNLYSLIIVSVIFFFKYKIILKNIDLNHLTVNTYYSYYFINLGNN